MEKQCIFCKQNSNNSKSIEHILPESLGNHEFILDRGIVCDKCNNYFAREVEKPILELDDFKRIRFYQAIQSKKGRIPFSDALIVGDKVDFHWGKINGEQVLMMGVSPETANKIMENRPTLFFTKGITLDNKKFSYEISRFIAKVGIEMLVYRYIEYYKQIDEYDNETNLILDSALDVIVNFVRFGRKNKKPWCYTSEVVNGFKPFSNDIIATFDFCFENDFLYFIMTLFDTRFKINIFIDSL